ncbi:MAG: AtpZ/AtpI family protein [Chloroflexi bacterium]|nr:AtpZ/AtpI family protein [Chloroflexota bacterium]MCH8816546.1 AtpZ/AtpI family protein [Chloroflexota bacterium]
MGQPSDTRSTIELLGRLMGAGWVVALSIAGGAGGGFWLDRRFDTSPVLTLVGLTIGIVVAFAGMIQILNAMWDGDSDSSAEKPGNGGQDAPGGDNTTED